MPLFGEQWSDCGRSKLTPVVVLALQHCSCFVWAKDVVHEQVKEGHLDICKLFTPSQGVDFVSHDEKGLPELLVAACTPNDQNRKLDDCEKMRQWTLEVMSASEIHDVSTCRDTLSLAGCMMLIIDCACSTFQGCVCAHLLVLFPSWRHSCDHILQLVLIQRWNDW